MKEFSKKFQVKEFSCKKSWRTKELFLVRISLPKSEVKEFINKNSWRTKELVLVRISLPKSEKKIFF